ncbi:uncharacterized protein LOC121049844 [Rosa chinensis]|uniref:uncharacterized protein LOC121049844 n=1 Tax=Rosa chinensis TaxID=74649 RepID=UPI001AD8DC74|nr:uncharacterized protein LOC121049844 [Rosa chinensis]
MEAEACRAGLLFGIHQGWSDVVIESDSALLIAALKSEEDNFSELRWVAYHSSLCSVMLRPCGRACHRTFISVNHPVLPTPPRLNLQTNNLLGEVGALATRGQLNEALSDRACCIYTCGLSSP